MHVAVGIAALSTLVSATATEILSRPTLWTLQADGRTCAELSSEARQIFRDWRIDRDNTVDEEEIWGLYNPAAKNQLVVLYGSRANCQEISDAIRERSPLAPQIAWGKAKGGVRIGIAVVDARWEKPKDRIVLLRIQHVGKRALSIAGPQTGKKGNVVVHLDGRPIARGKARPRVHEQMTLGPGQIENVTLDLSDEAIPSGRHELVIVYLGRSSGPLTVFAQ